MTWQIPEEFINEYPNKDLDDYYLYYIKREGVESYEESRDTFQKLGVTFHKLIPMRASGFRTDLHRGYIATFKLTSEGRLLFVKYKRETMKYEVWNEHLVEEYLENNFVLGFRKSFIEEGILVSFKNGVIVDSGGDWEKEGW